MESVVLLIILAAPLLFVVFWLLSHLISSVFYVPYVMADSKAINDALNLAELKADERFYDLGCGSGDALLIAVKGFKARATGYEISPFPALLAKLRLMKFRNSKVLLSNFKRADLKNADVVYLYLFESVLEDIEDWFFTNIGKRTRVVTLAFKFKRHKPIKVSKTKNLKLTTNLYLYK